MGAPRDPDASSEADALVAEVRALLHDLGLGARRPIAGGSDLRRDLGLDSLGLAELLDRVERRFEVRLPEDLLASATTVDDWRRALEAARPARGAPRPPSPPTVPAPGGETPLPETATSLPEVVAYHLERHADRASLRLVGGSEGEATDERTVGQLAAEATEVARHLRALGLGPGERVGIMLGTSTTYFQILLGVLLAGAVPVPLYPPARAAQLEEHLGRQARLLDRAGAALLVVDPRVAAASRLVRALVPTLRAVRTPETLAETPGATADPLPTPKGDELALIQFTSGSTADPKGVMLTHDQILANIRAMGDAARVTSGDVFVSWLPLYHDMGLIGAFLAPLYFGFPLVVMSPLTFLARPATWLEAISRDHGTISAAPNVAYQLCVDRVPDEVLARLDLSSWRLAFNGSEPVRPRTIEAFAERFAPCGFRPETMCPAYGLGELGLGLAFTPLGHTPRVEWVARRPLARAGRAEPCPVGDPEGQPVVSCGRPLPGYELRVCDPLGRELPDRHEGAISCRGPSATKGYVGNEEATAALWRRGWLETGDLGFVADGEVFLTGRAKDLIIRAGRNLHPEDLELAIDTLEGVEPRGVAVVGTTDERSGTERLVVVVETTLADERERHRLEASVRARGADVAGIPPDEVVLVRPGALLRTASGKLRRGATLAAYEAGTLGRRPPPVALQLARLGLAGATTRARRLVPSLAALPFAAYAWAAALLVATTTAALLPLVATRRARWRLVRGAGRLLRALVGIDVAFQGDPPTPGAPAVVVANHASFVDGLVLLLAFSDPVVLVASTELERARLVGGFLRRLGCAFVERGDPGQGRASVEALIELLARGERVALFPEGSITREPGLRPFRLGAFAAAARTGCPVVPVGIAGTRDLLRPGSYLPRRGGIRVVFGQPILPGSAGFASQVDLRDAARAAVARLSGEADLAASRHAPTRRPARASDA